MAKGKDCLTRIEQALDRWERENERGFAELRQQVGRISNSLGMFAEGLIAPSVPRVFKHAGVEIRDYSLRRKSRWNGETMEFDVFGVGRRPETGAPVVVVVEVSAELMVRDIDWCLAKLPKLFDFFPEYRDYEVIGAVAGMVVKGDVLAYAESQGLVVLGPGEEVARWMNRKGFVPKVWRAGGGR